MRKYIFELSIAIGLIAALSLGAYAKSRQSDIAGKLIRLHVIANSDSEEDQALKIKVRDAVLTFVTEKTQGAKTVAESEKILKSSLSEINKAAQEEIKRQGYSYTSKTALENTYFPTKEYGSFALPAGDYEALRVIIGSGEGKNWWCVLFPPLCVSAAEDTEELAKNAGLSDEEIKIISSDDVEYKFKFKVVDLINRAAHKINPQ